jgi:GntR family transcriptional regulator / MocR family aminotransferase
VPPALIARFREERLKHGAPPSLIAQPTLAEFMTSGAFAIHIRRMRRIYANRRSALIEALKPGDGRLYTIDAAPSGLTLLLRLAPGSDDDAIAAKLHAIGIDVTALSGHYAGRNHAPGLLLSFAGFPERDLRRAASRLMEELKT